MKNFFKKAKQAYKSHFFLTQEGVAPPEGEEADKIIEDINPAKEEGPQGYIAFCEDGTNNEQSSSTSNGANNAQPSSEHEAPANNNQTPSGSSSTPSSPTTNAVNTKEQQLQKDLPALPGQKEGADVQQPQNTTSSTESTPSNPTTQAETPTSTPTTPTQPQPSQNDLNTSKVINHDKGSTKDSHHSKDNKEKEKKPKTKLWSLSFGGGKKDKGETATDKKQANTTPNGNNSNNNNLNLNIVPTKEKVTGSGDKKEEEKPREIIYVKGLEDLPEDCLKLIKISGLPEEKLKANFQILLHVLHFRTGKIIKLQDEPPKEPRKKFHSDRFNDGESLLVHVEPPQLKKLYKDSDQVGKGGFGTVYFARSTKEKKLVAIKKMPHITQRQKTQNFREASILSKCNHPNIVKLFTCHIDKDQNLWLIMEFMEGGTFEEAAKAWKFNENNLAYVARELLKGLQYLHENGMVHRDLKSANIMMSVEGKVKLIDFGLCEDVSTGSPCHMVGSPFWMAPEMIQAKPHSTPVDIWSFAISLLEMANQRPPMMESAVKAMFTVATDGATGFDDPENWSDTFKDFLSLCLKPDPEERATAEQLLKHPFIKKADTRDNMENILKKIFLTNSLMNSGF